MNIDRRHIGILCLKQNKKMPHYYYYSSSQRLYMKMDLKLPKISKPRHVIYFWNPEIERKRPLSKNCHFSYFLLVFSKMDKSTFLKSRKMTIFLIEAFYALSQDSEKHITCLGFEILGNFRSIFK